MAQNSGPSRPGPVAPGEYLLRNLTSRPELNGEVCMVCGGQFGASTPKPINAVILQRTGESFSVHNDKLVPLEDAEAELVYDEADLALKEHPLTADSLPVLSLQPAGRAPPQPFAVRLHGLQSAGGQALNGQLGSAFSDRGDGRLGVRLAHGESRAIRLENLLHTCEVVPLPSSYSAGEPRQPVPPAVASSRTAGEFDGSSRARPGFYVHAPPVLPPDAIGYEGAGWPGVYTDRRLRGVATAQSCHVSGDGRTHAPQYGYNVALTSWLSRVRTRHVGRGMARLAQEGAPRQVPVYRVHEHARCRRRHIDRTLRLHAVDARINPARQADVNRGRDLGRRRPRGRRRRARCHVAGWVRGHLDLLCGPQVLCPRPHQQLHRQASLQALAAR